MLMCNWPNCPNTELSSEGLINIGKYGGTSNHDKWLCPKHIPSDWSGWPASRMFPHELQAIHKYVEDNKEKFNKITKGAQSDE